MAEQKKKILIDLILGLAIVAVVVYLNKDMGYSVVHMLCNGFTAAGVLIGGMGGLKFVRNQGAFDVMTYGVTSVLHTSLPWLSSGNRLDGKEETFADYQARKNEARKPATDMLITGGVYLVIGIVLMVIYLATEG